MCCCVFSLSGTFFSRYFPSGFRGLALSHNTNTHKILPLQRPPPMASVPTGGPLPPAAATATAAPAAPVAAIPGACSLLLQYRLLQHLLLSICHPKAANKTPVIVWQGLPMLDQRSSLPVQQRLARRLILLQLSVTSGPPSRPTSRSYHRRFRSD